MNGRIAGAEVEVAPLREARLGSVRAHLAQDGYALLRGVLPLREVMAARAEVLARLRSVDEVTGDDFAPVVTGRSLRAERHPDLGRFWREVCEGAGVRRAVHGPGLRAVAEEAFAGPAEAFDFVWLRAMAPGRASAFHLDHPYMNRGSADVLTAWVPLGEVRASDGPIAVIEGSHCWEDIAVRVRGRDVDREAGFSGSFDADIPAMVRARGARVLSSAFMPGDVLVFGMFLLHGSLDNEAGDGRLRLSADVRWQPAGAARDMRWFGTPPPGHGGLSYGGLSGARPLTAAPIRR